MEVSRSLRSFWPRIRSIRAKLTFDRRSLTSFRRQSTASGLYRLVIDRPTIGRAALAGDGNSRPAPSSQEWIVGLGRRTAQTRLAHFLCEVSYRLQLSGHNDLDAFEFPLTQSELADVLGLSAVHVNRVLQVLRSRGLIELNRHRLVIRNRPGLYEISEFDPGYLQGMQVSDRGHLNASLSFISGRRRSQQGRCRHGISSRNSRPLPKRHLEGESRFLGGRGD